MLQDKHKIEENSALKDYFRDMKNKRNSKFSSQKITEWGAVPQTIHRHTNSFNITTTNKSRIKFLPLHLKSNYKGKILFLFNYKIKLNSQQIPKIFL